MVKQLDIKDAIIYVPVRMSVALKNRIAKEADKNDNSMNRQVVELIEKGLETLS